MKYNLFQRNWQDNNNDNMDIFLEIMHTNNNDYHGL